jgi:hypothetical protein
LVDSDYIWNTTTIDKLAMDNGSWALGAIMVMLKSACGNTWLE